MHWLCKRRNTQSYWSYIGLTERFGLCLGSIQEFWLTLYWKAVQVHRTDASSQCEYFLLSCMEYAITLIICYMPVLLLLPTTEVVQWVEMTTALCMYCIPMCLEIMCISRKYSYPPPLPPWSTIGNSKEGNCQRVLQATSFLVFLLFNLKIGKAILRVVVSRSKISLLRFP